MKKIGIVLLFIMVLCIGVLLLPSSNELRLRLFVVCLKLIPEKMFEKMFPNEEIWIDLGNGYDYLNEYALLDQTGYPGDGIFYMGIPFISPKIEEYKFNENYITAKQKYSIKNSSKLLRTILYDIGGRVEKMDANVFPVYDSIIYNTFEKYHKYTSTSMRVQSFCDSVVNNNPYFKVMEKNDYNYYIIEKDSVVKYGPMSRKEFEAKFISLNLPSSIWINE
jgi:hypothetical protein